MITTLVIISLATALPLAIGGVLYLGQSRIESSAQDRDLDSVR